MLKDATAHGIRKVYIACGFTDLRTGIDGLSLLVQEQFLLNPLEKGTLFLFCGRKSDRIKGLQYTWLMKGFNPLQPGLIEEVNPTRIG